MNFWQFANDSPLTAIVLCYLFLYCFGNVCNRLIRHFNIRSKGWPTVPRMDADGDIVKDDD